MVALSCPTYPGFWLAALSLAFASPLPANSSSPICSPDAPEGPYRITEDCIDPMFTSPVLTGQIDEISLVPHRRVSGYFNGTKVDFNIYLPAAAVWKGRFFQHVYPLQNSTARPERVAFGVANGAYTVSVAGAVGFRADAATAKFSRKVAADYYHPRSDHIYGYVYGGSGGSYSVAGAMESTTGVWDGGMMLVQGIPVSNPNNFAIRALGGIVLANKKAEIVDSLAPGGSGNPFSNLSSTERAILTEMTALGVPLSAWEDFDAVGLNKTGLLNNFTPLVSGAIQERDPTYPCDFWTKPGYLGTEESELGDIFRKALVLFNSTIEDIIYGNDSVPVAITIADVPANSSTRGLQFAVYNANGTTAITGVLFPQNKTISIASGSNPTALDTLERGATIQADNRLFLSGFALHRHQVPPVEAGFYGYDILRDGNAEPLYPQREVLIAPIVSSGASGGVSHSGNITAKVMVLQTLLDNDAFPWHADWYKRQVQKSLGDRFEGNYRLYYMESGYHYIESPQLDPPDSSRIIPSGGHIEQQLLDLSDWVERGVAPAKSTNYTISEGSQIHVSGDAATRGGIQPTVSLTVECGANRTQVATGAVVAFQVHVETPPGKGDVVSVEWDFKGEGIFTAGDLGSISPSVDVSTTYVYEEAGVYFAGVRISSQREGNPDTPFARVWNLARVRVIVV
ncbi:hypothetical protein DL98DRAFT_539327 [Cadophora sp. DSE1049]|nr:hypothetical protein DL98DRAFT_539327 [Cadophora sp. DSE1049]